MANRVDIKVGYSIDKNGLNELKKQLTDLRLEAAQAKLSGNLTKELNEASKAASKLEDILTKSWNSKLNQLDLSKVNNGIKTTYGNVQNLQKALTQSGAAGATAYNNFAMSVLNTNTQLKKTSDTLDKMAVTFKNTVRYGISSTVFNSLSNSIQRAYSYAKELDTSLNDIRIVTGKSADEMDRFAVRANKVAKELGRSTKDFTNAALIYYQQGLGNEEAQARAEVTMKAANVTGQSGREVSEQLTAVWNGYKVTADEAELYVDKLAAVAATTASDLEELSTGMSKVASAANLMGVDIDQLNAQLATIVSVTRQAPESVGTALKTIYARMSNIQAGLDDETTLGNYTEKMAQMGVNVLNANGQLRDMGDVIEEIGAKWATMSREQQIALSQTMAGTRQYNNLLSLFDNWDMYTNALQTSADAAGTLQKQQDIYMESTEAHLQKLSTEAERTYDILFDQDAVNGFSDALTGVLNIFNNLLAGLGGGINDFVFFGSTIANIFNKQIGQSIERQIENIEAMKANISREELQRQIINAHSARGENVTNAEALDKEISYAEKTLELQKYLTQEQAEYLAGETAEIGKLEQRIQGITQYKAIAEKLGVSIGKDAAETQEHFEEQIRAQNELYKIENNRFKALKKGMADYVEGTTHAFDSLEAQQKITDELVLNLGDMKNSKEDEARVISIIDKISDKEKLTEEDIKFVLDTQRNIRNDINNKVQQLKIGAAGVADEEAGLLVDLQNEQELREQNLQTTQQQIERQARLSQIVQGLSATVSLLTSLTGILKTLNDDDLTIGEKAERIITVLLTSLPIIITNFSAIKMLIPNLLVQFGLLTTSEVTAATAAGTLGTAIWGALAPLLPIILPIVAIIGVLGVTIWAAVEASQAEEKSIKNLRKAAKELSEEAEKTKQSIDSLKSSLNGYTEAVKTLQACTENTNEWNTALQNVNETVLEILDKYPQLAKIKDFVTRDSTTGALKINEEIVNQYTRAVTSRYLTQKAGAVTATAVADQKEAAKTIDEILQTINFRFSKVRTFSTAGDRLMTPEEESILRTPMGSVLSKEDLKELQKVAEIPSEFNDKVTEFTDSLVQAGKITKDEAKTTALTIKTYREEIAKATEQSVQAENAITNASMIIASNALGSNATNVQQQLFAQAYQSTYDAERKKIDDLLRNGMSKAGDRNNANYQKIVPMLDAAMGGGIYTQSKDKNAVRGTDNNRVLLFYNNETEEDEEWDREKIISAIAAYNAQQNAEKARTFDTAAEILQKVAEEGSIDEGLADKVLNRTFDINQLTEDEYNQIKANKDKIADALTDDQLAKIGWENAQKFKDHFEAELSEWDPEEALANAKERFRNALDIAGEKANAMFGFDAKDFSDFAQYLADIADESEELADTMDENANDTEIVTRSILRMNKGIESLAKGWEEWNKILKQSSKESEEYWKALRNIQDAVIDLLDANEDLRKFLDDDFINENSEKIQAAANGDAEAINNLRAATLEHIVLNLELNDSALTNGELWTEIQNLQTMLNSLDVNLDVGAHIDDASFIEACQQIINDAKLTKEQANLLFGQMGFEAHYKTESQPTQTEVPIYTTYVRSHKTRDEDTGLRETGWIPQQETMTVRTGTETLTGEYATFAMSTTTPDGGNSTPVIEGFTKKATGSFNNYSSRNKGGGSPGGGSGNKGGGGSSKAKEPDHKDPIEEELNRYHDVDIQLTQISTDLKRLEDQKKKLFGKDLIDNLNKQLALLNKQIETTRQKIEIANGETKELQDKLSEKGVLFNEDGTIANYADVYVAQMAHVNAIIDEYNNMSAEAQEAAKDTVKDAEDEFKEFLKYIDRYDELVSKTLPGLEDDIQKAIDEQITMQIEKFDMEIQIRLDMAEAERDWNEFKKTIIDEVENDNILGQAIGKLTDFSSYYKEDSTGIVQSLTKQINDTLAELNKMDNGQDNVFGNDRETALKKLEEYYTTLMKNMTDVAELQKEIHEAYIDMQDEAQKKFDEQVETYEMIGDLIDHDMKVIQMVYGEDSYAALSKYYNRQQENNNKQLDFQRQEVEFWKQQMDSAEKGSKAWENAKEHWEDAVKKWKDKITDSIEVIQKEYLNAINEIFANLNNKITNGLGLDYVNEQWNLINKNAEQYLDSINALYETQALENKYLDAIDKTDSVGAQRQLKELMDAELADLRERDKLTQYDVERANKKYEIALKQIALQEAQQNKTTMRLRRDSQGNYRYEYTSDSDQVSQIQDELNGLYNSLYNFDKARYQENLGQIYDVWNEFQEKMAEAAQINDPQERAERELLLEEQYGELINGLVEQNSQIRLNLQDSAFEDLSRLYDKDIKEYTNMTEAETDALMNGLVPQWESGVQAMADVFAGEGGFLPVCRDALEELRDATNQYQSDLDDLQRDAGEDFNKIQQEIDYTIDETEDLLYANDDLIGSYEDEMIAIDDVCKQLDRLVDKYHEARDAAIAAAKAAYEYSSDQNRKAADAAKDEANLSQATARYDESAKAAEKAASDAYNEAKSKAGNAGDGNLSVGEAVTFSGKYYYDSYGTSPVGSRYSGVTNGVVVDRITNNPYGIHIHSADGKYMDLGWVKKSQLSGYDTGGYTGAWGNDGRLALLHQKELVLNAHDTENMLNAVTIMRDITSTLGGSILSRLAGIAAANANGTASNGLLDQNVSIQATFPNVTSSREIEDALNNLVNMAAIRANRKGS